MARKTQEMKILQVWIRRQAGDISRFFLGSDFLDQPMGSPDHVGYKAPTRFCELCVEFPDLIETKKIGRFRAGRIRFENSEVFLKTLPKDLLSVVRDEMERSGVSFKKRVMEPEYTPNGVRLVEKVVEVNPEKTL